MGTTSMEKSCFCSSFDLLKWLKMQAIIFESSNVISFVSVVLDLVVDFF